jgi:multidrug efflux pump subunit AcrA (membrane-fusion protein)
MRDREGATEPALLDLPGLFDATDGLLADGAAGEMDDAPRPTPWWRSRGAIIAVSAVLVLAVLAGGGVALAQRRGSGVTYVAQPVTRGDLSLTISATGPVQATIYNVTFAGSGKLAAIDVTIGQQVNAGDVLARLDPTSLQDALNQAEANYSAARVALDNARTNQQKVQAQTQAQVAAAADQEQNAIYVCNHPAGGGEATPTPTPSPGCIQTAQDQYAAAQAQANQQNAAAAAQVSNAAAQLNSADQQLQTAQHNLGNTTLTAPHAGTIATINGSVGGTPGVSGTTSSASGVGSGGGGVFIQIVDLSSLQVQADVNEADIGGVAVGQPVVFTVSAYGSRQFRGMVSAVSPLGQTVANVVTYPVSIQVRLPLPQGVSLLPGMTATVTISTAERSGVLLVPAGAVTFARAAADPNSYHFITRDQQAAGLRQARQLLDTLVSGAADSAKDNPTPAIVLERAENAWVIKPVVLGLTDGTSYEALAGLSEGESVIVGAQGASLPTPASGGSGGGRGGGRNPFGGGG